jgi:hypothetical protein
MDARLVLAEFPSWIVLELPWLPKEALHFTGAMARMPALDAPETDLLLAHLLSLW